MTIQLQGGLCNRLRTLLSYRASGETDFIWARDGEIAGAHFNDVFLALPGVRWVEWADKATCTGDPCPYAPVYWRHHYAHLGLREKLPRIPRPYAAMHVRRTDHLSYAEQCGGCTADSDFAAWLQSAANDVFLATDNGTTQTDWVRRIQDSGRNAYTAGFIEAHPEENVGGRRNTSLAHAAADLFVCAGANEFRGSHASSFTDTVILLRGMVGWWS
jgi:hypothetical protein